MLSVRDRALYKSLWPVLRCVPHRCELNDYGQGAPWSAVLCARLLYMLLTVGGAPLSALLVLTQGMQ